MNKPGILLVGNFLSSHAGTRSVGEELSSHLSVCGWKIIETSHVSGRIFRLMDMVSSAIRHRNEYQVAYVEVYSGLAFFWAEVLVHLLALLQKPVVLTLHGGALVEFAHKYPARVTRLLAISQIVVTPSLFLQDGLKPYLSDIRYLPNAVDVDQYTFRLQDHPSPNIIWMRAFHEIYQPEFAVMVLSDLVQDFDTITLTMIGPDKKDGSLNATLKLAERLGVRSHIRIVGSIAKSEVPIWLARGDVFLNTTRFESFGVSVLEAALIGLPIVTTNVGELSYLWKNETTAMLVPPNDPKAMANVIRRILVEPQFAACLAQNARLRAEQFDWSLILPEWEKTFYEIYNG